METENKERPVKFIEIMNQMVLTDIFRIFHPKTKKYTFF
jgi:exonuclease III